MSKSLTIKSFAVSAAMIGMLLAIPGQAVAGFHFGGSHGGGGFHVSAPRPAVHVGGFHGPVGGFRPTVRPAFHPAFHPAMHVAAPRIRTGGFPVGHHPIRVAGPVRPIGPRGFGHDNGGRARTGFLQPRGDHHVRLPHGPILPAFYPSDEVEPDVVAQPPVVVQDEVVGPEAVGVAEAPAGRLQGERLQADRLQAERPVKAGGPRTGGIAACGSTVAVRFASKATVADISGFLTAYNVSVSNGPSTDGSVHICLSDKPLAPDEMNQVIRSMQSQTAIVSSVSQS